MQYQHVLEQFPEGIVSVFDVLHQFTRPPQARMHPWAFLPQPKFN